MKKWPAEEKLVRIDIFCAENSRFQFTTVAIHSKQKLLKLFTAGIEEPQRAHPTQQSAAETNQNSQSYSGMKFEIVKNRRQTAARSSAAANGGALRPHTGRLSSWDLRLPYGPEGSGAPWIPGKKRAGQQTDTHTYTQTQDL